MCKICAASHEPPSAHPPPTVCGSRANWLGQFQAMASDCDALIEDLSQEYAMEAGMLSTIAMLQGADAELFLDAQEAQY